MKLEKMGCWMLEEASAMLSEYWKERGMPEYDAAWTLNYLKQGHKKEIVKDEFFVCKYEGKTVGVVALVTGVGGIAEIRDEVLRKDYQNLAKEMLDEVIKVAKQRKLRKIFSLALPQMEKAYSEAGFHKEGVLKDHFRKGENLSVMSLLL